MAKKSKPASSKKQGDNVRTSPRTKTVNRSGIAGFTPSVSTIASALGADQLTPPNIGAPPVIPPTAGPRKKTTGRRAPPPPPPSGPPPAPPFGA